MEDNKNLQETTETKVEETVENPESNTSETKVEEITPVDMNVDLHEMDLNINTDNLEETVEKRRGEVHGKYKQARKISNIATLIMVIFVIASFVLIVQDGDAFKITGYVLGGVALVGMLIYYIANRNRLPGLIKEYMSEINSMFNAYLYKDNKYEKLTMDPNEKAEMGVMASDRVYLNIAGCGSRNIIHGSFENHPFMIGDVALSGIGEKSKQVDFFVGKYLTCENNYKFDGRVIINICLKGEKTFDLPTDIKDLVKVEQVEQTTVYATPGLDYKKIFTNELINKLNHLDVKEEKHLLNVNVVVWGGHTAVYLSYDNSLMSFPFDQPFKKESISEFKKDQNIVFDIFDMMMNEKTIKTDASVKPAIELASKEEDKVEETKEEAK